MDQALGTEGPAPHGAAPLLRGAVAAKYAARSSVGWFETGRGPRVRRGGVGQTSEIYARAAAVGALGVSAAALVVAIAAVADAY